MINLSVNLLSHKKEETARANGVPEWRLQYDIDFESVIRGHHIYKTVWKPEIGERLACKKDDRKEAALYDENATGVYKQLEVDQKPEFILVGHLPMELSFLGTGHKVQGGSPAEIGGGSSIFKLTKRGGSPKYWSCLWGGPS